MPRQRGRLGQIPHYQRKLQHQNPWRLLWRTGQSFEQKSGKIQAKKDGLLTKKQLDKKNALEAETKKKEAVSAAIEAKNAPVVEEEPVAELEEVAEEVIAEEEVTEEAAPVEEAEEVAVVAEEVAPVAEAEEVVAEEVAPVAEVEEAATEEVSKETPAAE